MALAQGVPPGLGTKTNGSLSGDPKPTDLMLIQHSIYPSSELVATF